MINTKQLITQNLIRIVRELTKAASAQGYGEPREPIDVQVSISEKDENGDYYTNVALRLASILKKKPLDIAYEIKTEFEKALDTLDTPDTSDTLARVEVAAPGFVNFFLSKKYLLNGVAQVNKKGGEFGSSENLKGQKIMVEFTDPNPFKEFHIGHLYSNIVGESISRLYESQGAQVFRVCYQGDVGLHVAKAIYGMQKLAVQTPKNDAPLSIRAQFMGGAYALGSHDYEGSASSKQSINDLNKKVYERTDKKLNELYDKGREWSLEYFDSIYKRLGTKFEHFYFESEVGKKGVELVREFLKKKVFVESDGAIIFPGEKFGLHNRVFINSLGLPTYEAKDLGLAPLKYSDYKYDKSIIITAHEQAPYFQVVLKALELINPELAAKTKHLPHGMVRLPTGKMSSRTGDVITGEWLIDEAVARIRKEYPEMNYETAEKVALAAIKFALLKSSVGMDIEFNFNESIALSGASGPYIQYTYVRTQSLLKKSPVASRQWPVANTEKSEERIANGEELAVLRRLVYFPEIVEMAADKLSPNIVSEYLLELSQAFNLFYQKHKIADDSFRLKLTAAVGQTLKTGLNLLGIETVQAM